MVLPPRLRSGALSSFVFLIGALMAAWPVAAQQPPARVWTAPEVLTPATQLSRLPQVSMDGSGNALVTWIGEQGAARQAQAASVSSSGSWSPLINLFSPAASTAVPFESTDVSLNSAGRGAAVWVRAIGAGPSDQLAQAAIFTGTSWRAATNLMPVAAAGVRSPRVGVDSDGNAIAVWVQVLNGVAVVRASRYTWGGAWSVPVTVSAATDSVDDGVVLGVDDTGNAVAAWTGTAGGVTALRAAQYAEVTNTWSAPVTVAPAGRSPAVLRLALNRAGTAAFVAYRGFDGTYDVARAARLDPASGTWSAPVDLSAAGQSAVDVDIAVDEQDRAVAIWNLLNGTVQSARFNGTWGSATDRTSGALTRDVGVDTDAAGNAVATWTRWDGARYRVQAATYTVATALWSAGVDVSDTTGDAVEPRPRLHSDGTALIVWQSDSDAAYVQASRYVLAATPQLRRAVVDGSSVTLSWSAGQGTPPSNYMLVASLTPGGPPIVQASIGTSTSVVVTALSGGYYVRVLATVNGVQVPSNEILVIVGAGPAPTAPQDLIATVNGNVVTLTWAPPVNESIAPVRTYHIAAGSVPGASNLAFFPTGNAQTTFTTGAVPNGSYWVRVYAESAGGLGAASADIRVVVGPPPPGAPVLSGGATGPGAVQLQWTAAPAPGAAVTGYQLRAGYQPGQSNAAVINLPASSLGYAANGIPPGTYYVRVVALSSAGPGEVSNEVVVTIP